MNRFVFLLLFLLNAISVSAQTIHYVNTAANGQNNGTSWTDAFTDLQNAIAVADSGEMIWVAQGVYKPTVGTTRTISFEPKSGVALYGGFAGVENSLQQRDWKVYTTVLSGDIGIVNNASDNSFNVVYLHLPDSTTIIDGFTIRHGNANDIFVTTLRERKRCGGAIYINGENWEAYPTISNCYFYRNNARNAGGAVFINGAGTGSVAPLFKHCFFEENTTPGTGGAIYRLGGSWVERYGDISDCTFARNQAYNGGGLAFVQSERTDNFELLRDSFVENYATMWGGGHYLQLGRNGNESVLVSHCVFNNNQVGNLGLDGYYISLNERLTDSVNIRHCLFMNHQSPGKSSLVILPLYGKNTSVLNASDNTVINNFFTHFLFIEYSNNEMFDFFNNIIEKNTIGSCFYVSIGKKIYAKNNKIYNNKIFNMSNFAGNISEFHYEGGYVHLQNEVSGGLFSIIKMKKLTFSNAAFHGPLYYNNSLIEISDSVFIHNCIFGNNQEYLEQIYASNHYTKISHSYFDTLNCDNTYGYNVTCGDGILKGTSGISPMYRDTANDDFRLLPCSPLINAGTNGVIQPGATDHEGQPRIQGGTVDIGPYESASLALSAPAEVLPACVGSSNGSIVFVPDNACLPLQFNWAGPVSGSGTNLSGLPSGTYQITITDGKNETLQTEVNVGAATPPQATVQTTPVMCGTNIGGSATPVVEGNWPPYQFNWSNSSTDSVAMQLPAGAYLVTITDARGCTGTGTAQVNRLGSISVQILPTEISCYNTTDGALEIQPANGVAPFHWLWASGDTTAALQNLGEGIYSGFLTDGLNCAISWNIPLESPDSLRSNADIAHATGPNTPNGSIDLSPTGGTGNISVLWSTGDINFSISGLLPGTYTVTLTDDNGCSSVEQHVVTSEVSSNNPARPPVVKVFPNPAHERINWTGMDADRARLWSSTGALVRESTGNFMPLNGVPGGAYTLEIVGKGGVFRGRIVVF